MDQSSAHFRNAIMDDYYCDSGSQFSSRFGLIPCKPLITLLDEKRNAKSERILKFETAIIC